MSFNISDKGLTSLKYINYPPGITILDCSHNLLINLEGCPDGIIELYCGFNKIHSFIGCPNSVKKIYCSYNSIENLIGCPNNIQFLHCPHNQINSLENCPNTIEELYCDYNNITDIWEKFNDLTFFKELKIFSITYNNIDLLDGRYVSDLISLILHSTFTSRYNFAVSDIQNYIVDLYKRLTNSKNYYCWYDLIMRFHYLLFFPLKE